MFNEKRRTRLFGVVVFLLCCQPSFGQVVYQELVLDAINVTRAGVSVSNGRLWNFYPTPTGDSGTGIITAQSAAGLGPLTTVMAVAGGTVTAKAPVGSSIVSTSFGPSGALGLLGIYEFATSRVATYQEGEGSKPPQKLCGSYTLGGKAFNGSLNSGPFPSFDGSYYFGGSGALLELGKVNSATATCDLTLVTSSSREIVKALKLSSTRFLVSS